LNEEKLCQVLANQTRALQKKRSQGASHAHHLPIKPLQSQASLRVPETVAQVQTSSHVKMVAVVVQNSALQTPMPHALHAQRVHSLKLVLLRLMAHVMSVRVTATAMIELLAKTVADALHMATAMTVVLVAETVVVTRVVQTVLRMATVMIVHLAKTVVVTRVVQTVLRMATAITPVVKSVQTTVVVTGLLEEMKVQVVQLKRLGVLAKIAMRVLRMATAMTAALVTHVLLSEAVMQIVRHVLLVTAKIVQHVQVLVVASATATVQSVLHTASQIHLASKTALQSAVGQKIVVVTQVAIHLAKSAIPTVQTVQHAMIHANHHSAVHATQTQTRRLSSKTRFLSV
jgi:hypothetical protein